MKNMYNTRLDNGAYLQAFSIDPKIGSSELEEFLLAKEGDQPAIIARDISLVKYLKNVDDLEVKLNLDKQYQVPELLKAYREAIGRDSDAKGRYNGPVALVSEPVGIPLNFSKGGYYDFIATKLTAVPHELVPNKYPAGRTVKQLFEDNGIDPSERARFFGLAYLLITEDENLSLVQRAKGMAIAPDCMAMPGSTPNPKFEAGFNFQEYLKQHISEEINEEFALKNPEFKIGGMLLMNDKSEIPFGVVEINTDVPMLEISQRLYGNQQAIKEHPIIYSVQMEGIDSLLKKYPIHPPTVRVLETYQNRVG